MAHSTPLQLNDDISWVKGNHQINFGVGGEVSKMLFDGNVYSQTNWTFPNLPQFLLGQFSTNSLSLPNTLDLQKWFVNAYVQDTWKVTSPLDRQRRSALGTVPRSLGAQGLYLQLQPGEYDQQREDHAICERASRPHVPRGSWVPTASKA